MRTRAWRPSGFLRTPPARSARLFRRNGGANFSIASNRPAARWARVVWISIFGLISRRTSTRAAPPKTPRYTSGSVDFNTQPLAHDEIDTAVRAQHSQRLLLFHNRLRRHATRESREATRLKMTAAVSFTGATPQKCRYQAVAVAIAPPVRTASAYAAAASPSHVVGSVRAEMNVDLLQFIVLGREPSGISRTRPSQSSSKAPSVRTARRADWIASATASRGLFTSGCVRDIVISEKGLSKRSLKWPREAGPFLAAAKLEIRLLVVLYQAAKGSVCC